MWKFTWLPRSWSSLAPLLLDLLHRSCGLGLLDLVPHRTTLVARGEVDGLLAREVRGAALAGDGGVLREDHVVLWRRVRPGDELRRANELVGLVERTLPVRLEHQPGEALVHRIRIEREIAVPCLRRGLQFVAGILGIGQGAVRQL